MMPATTPEDDKRAELVLLSTLHRVSGVPVGRVTEADLDRRIAERPITDRFSRGLGQKNPDPLAWFRNAEAEAANESWIREQFADGPPPWPSGPTLAMVAIGIVAAIGLAVGWLG